MAANSNGSLLLQDHQTFDSSLSIIDSRSTILFQFSESHTPGFLELTPDSFSLERGPRYIEYSVLRETKIRLKNAVERHSPEKETLQMLKDRPVLTPQKKQVKFQGNLNAAAPPKRPKRPSVLTQSVPDLSAVVRKENRLPVVALPPLVERTVTPPAGLHKSGAILVKLGGSKSTNSAEKRRGGLMEARRSCTTICELKEMATAAGKAIDRENRGGRVSPVIGKTF